MALQSFFNNHGTLLSPLPTFGLQISTGSMTFDAAGESAAGIGYINLSSGPGTSKTISAAGGGKFAFYAGTCTLVNGSSNLRLGVQDVGATGIEDGTFDVYADVAGAGGGAVASAAVNSFAMTSGTKTIAHGDRVALVGELTARAGADSIIFIRSSTQGVSVPYSTADTGSGPAKGTFGLPFITLVFDDGTVGWLDNHPAAVATTSSTFSSSSTPDEYALVFQIPFRSAAVGLMCFLSSVAATDDFELILYSDPLGTPVAERTLTQDADLLEITAGQMYSRPFTSAYTLEPNTNYAIALRPTTTNTLAFYRYQYNTGNGALRGTTALGTNWSQYTRSDNTGAFGSQDTTILPLFGVWLSQLSDDAGGGGGTVVVPQSAQPFGHMRAF
jgi:hypothetical protein